MAQFAAMQGDIWSLGGISFARYLSLAPPVSNHHSCPSPVNDILDKESFTLEELLQEDEILQEVKARNGRLIDL